GSEAGGNDGRTPPPLGAGHVLGAAASCVLALRKVQSSAVIGLQKSPSSTAPFSPSRQTAGKRPGDLKNPGEGRGSFVLRSEVGRGRCPVSSWAQMLTRYNIDRNIYAGGSPDSRK